MPNHRAYFINHIGVIVIGSCLYCGTETENQKFCSCSCAAKYNNPRKPKKPYPLCKNCGKILRRRNSIFCNNVCQQEYEYSQFVLRWKEGAENGVIGAYQTSRYIKRYLFEKFDGKCARCGWHEINPYTKKIPLEVEHIDGNYMNNDEDNLTLLCPNCHS